MGDLRTAARTVGTLGLLSLPLPLNAAVTATALLRRTVTGPRPRPTAEPRRTVLISGGKMTKALALARAFDAAGHRVILTESAKYRLTGHRWSRAVSQFHVLPDPGAPDYLGALINLVRRERVDVFVPVSSPASAHHEAEAGAALSDLCEVVHGDTEAVDQVDDKYRFATTAASLGLPVPTAHRITHPDQVADLADDDGPWVLKSIAYDPVHRLDLTPLPRATREETREFAASKPISEANPWVLQRFVAGQEYCTHSTVRDGRVQLHCCCRSSNFQLNYEMVDVPEIEAWVRRFVSGLGLTGQYSFDFIQAGDGTFQAIECNPRTHSAITLFGGHPDVARAYLDDGVATVTPLPASRPTYWLYYEVWRLLRHPSTWRTRLPTLRHGRDAVFDWEDPLPFLLLHHLHLPALLLGNLRAGRDWLRIDVNIGKLVEPAGD